MKIWDTKGADTQGVTTLPDAVTRVPPSLLLQKSMLLVEPNYTTYYNVVMEQLKRITEIRESGLAEVNLMPDEDVDMFLKACLDANEEMQGDVYIEEEGPALSRLESGSCDRSACRAYLRS